MRRSSLPLAASALLCCTLGCADGEAQDAQDAGATESDGGVKDGGSTGEPAALAGITAAHNEVRAGVGVGPLSWSDSLAQTAQTWADGCRDQQAPIGAVDHNPGRSNGHPWYVGENIFSSSGTVAASVAVSAWASEVADYDYDSNTCSAECGHYTQVVWAASLEVGCGVSQCPGLTFPFTIVCNYGPGGNTGGRPY